MYEYITCACVRIQCFSVVAFKLTSNAIVAFLSVKQKLQPFKKVQSYCRSICTRMCEGGVNSVCGLKPIRVAYQGEKGCICWLGRWYVRVNCLLHNLIWFSAPPHCPAVGRERCDFSEGSNKISGVMILIGQKSDLG